MTVNTHFTTEHKKNSIDRSIVEVTDNLYKILILITELILNKFIRVIKNCQTSNFGTTGQKLIK